MFHHWQAVATTWVCVPIGVSPQALVLEHPFADLGPSMPWPVGVEGTQSVRRSLWLLPGASLGGLLVSFIHIPHDGDVSQHAQAVVVVSSESEVSFVPPSSGREPVVVG